MKLKIKRTRASAPRRQQVLAELKRVGAALSRSWRGTRDIRLIMADLRGQ